MSHPRAPGLLRKISFRRGLTLTIMTMGFFTLALIVLMGRFYQQLVIDAEQQTLSNIIAAESDQVMHALAEDVRQLGLDIQSDSGVRQAMLNRDSAALSAELANQFRRYFVTASVVRLESIIALDKELSQLGSVTRDGKAGSNATICPKLLEKAQARQGSRRLQLLSQTCLNGNLFQHQVLIPAGLAPLGYILIVSDPAHNLQTLEHHLGRPIEIYRNDGSLLYRSPAWQDAVLNDDILLAEHRLSGDDGSDGISILAQGTLHANHSKLGEIQYIVLIIAILATIATMIAAHYVTRKIIIEPLQVLVEQLRRSDAGRRITDKAPDNLKAICEFSELQELYDELQDIALTDPLTQLPNRLCFERRMEDLFESMRNEDDHHALCYLDLDRFKEINDSCGHAAGDLLLQQLADLFRKQIRSVDTFARVGGDEFALLLKHCSPSDAMRMANQIREAVENFQFLWQNKQFNVGVSIGVVPVSSDSGSIARILSLADASCYIAKQQGRNQVHLHQDVINTDMSATAF